MGPTARLSAWTTAAFAASAEQTPLWLQLGTYQNDPQTPQVAGLVVAVVLENLGSGVLQREAGGLQQLVVWWFETSKAKVYDFYLRVLTLICEEQVLRGNLRHGQQS